jgi:hypothetical protein
MIHNVEFARPNTPDGDTKPWHIHLVFNNFGKTPAYSAVFQVERTLRTNPPVDLRLELTDAATISAPAIIPSGHIHTLRLGGFDGGLADFVEARRSGQVCFAWGRVDYIDTFGSHHFTTFQMACNFGQVHQFGFCQNGNGTDDRFRRWWKSPKVLTPNIGTEDEKPMAQNR